MKTMPNYGKSSKERSGKMHKVMREFKEGELHSGSKSGPKVSSRKQAVAIALSEAGKAKALKKRTHVVGNKHTNFENPSRSSKHNADL